MSNNKWVRVVLSTSLLAIGVFYALMLWFHTYTGDDLMYRANWLNDYDNNLLNYPLFFVRHWLHLNGRIGDKINPFMLAMMPKLMFAVINGVVTLLMYWQIIKCSEISRKAGFVGRISLICSIMFGLTWWDYMVVYVCNLNYIWAAAFALTTLWMILAARDCSNKVSLFCLCLFAAMAGGMHEACGVPLACGLLVWLYLTKRELRLNRSKRFVLVSFFVGAAFSMSSPTSWQRFGVTVLSDNVPADIVVMRSAYFTLAMLAWLVVGMMIKPMRDNFKQLIRTPWVIFVVAAVASLPFCAVSGIIGRTGWFSQIFAVIAVFYYYNATGLRVNRRLAAVLSVVLIMLIASHCAVALRQQYIMGRELATMIELYRQSPDGVVYMDYTPDSAQHPWALRKARGVHDPEESYYIETISHYYGSPQRPLVIVPKALECIPASEIEGTISVGNCLISDAYTGERDGYVVVPFTKDGRQLYLYRPHEIDPDSPAFIPFR